MKQFLFFISIWSISLTAVTQNGRVGINTTTPQAMLHVKDSSVVFAGAIPAVIDFAANPPVSGGGVRMMWYAQRAAFRAGRVNDFDWDRDSVGLYSAAFGYDNKAKGENSFAVGMLNHATGLSSIAGGFASVAKGFYAIALGDVCYANGDYSLATGFNSTANGTNSMAMGATVTAKGNHSFATGINTRADGFRSSAFGNGTISKSPECMVVGVLNDTAFMTDPTDQDYTQPLFVVGNGITHNNRRNALVVLGNGKVGIGLPRSIFIQPIKASLHLHNDGTHEQQLAFTSSFSFNDTVYMRLDDRTFRFRNTNSFGSFWEFQDHHGTRKIFFSTADGSIAIEGSLTAKKECGINTTSPLAGLHIKAVNSTFDQHIRLESTLGSGSYANILYDGALKCRVFDPTGNFQWRDAPGNTRMTLTSAGNLTIAGTLTQNSDARLKKDVVPLENSLEKILTLSGYHYSWKDTSRGNVLQTGLLAQQIQTLMPELVTKDEEGILSVNYNGLIPYLIEAIKAQQQMIDDLKKHQR
ncbi:MAG TPA: tail fiber domain-containing protein [Chitinophagaceae bacterium]|jgi:hypothetical protein|nr:tail fiber domain-containing protein [Chitinophagaceae bacterium]